MITPLRVPLGGAVHRRLPDRGAGGAAAAARPAARPPGPAAPAGGRAAGAHRRGRRRGRDDRQGAAGPPAARPQPDRLRGRRPDQARPPAVRPAGPRRRWPRSRTWSAGTRSRRSIIAMPRAPGAVVRQVVRAALESGVKTRTVPGMFDIISGRVAVASLRQVEIQDLLRREPIQTDLEQVRVLATGETVLVTGAGGSIGSELCRQLARLEPGPDPAAGPRRELDLRRAGRADRALPQRDRRARSSPTCATASGCGRSSSSTARTRSSTPPRTSTCR